VIPCAAAVPAQMAATRRENNLIFGEKTVSGSTEVYKPFSRKYPYLWDPTLFEPLSLSGGQRCRRDAVSSLIIIIHLNSFV
jgi:hypothetical protein